MTVHKSQGQTLNKIVINLGSTELWLGTTFVALSRVKSYKDFLIEPFTLERLEKISKSDTLKFRLREESRINKIVNETLNTHKDLLQN